MPRPNPLESAAVLRNSPAASNFDQYDDVFAPPAEGHVPSAWEQATGDVVRNAAETTLGAGPAIDALRRVADERRLQTTNDLLASDADMEAHGLQRELTRAGIENQVGDVMGEGKARRGFLPWAQEANQRDMAARLQQLQLQYMAGPQIAAQGHVAAAQAEAQGRVDAAKALHTPLDPIEALRAAVLKRFQSGFPVDPSEIASLQTGFSSIK